MRVDVSVHLVSTSEDVGACRCLKRPLLNCLDMIRANLCFLSPPKFVPAMQWLYCIHILKAYEHAIYCYPCTYLLFECLLRATLLDHDLVSQHDQLGACAALSCQIQYEPQAVPLCELSTIEYPSRLMIKYRLRSRSSRAARHAINPGVWHKVFQMQMQITECFDIITSATAKSPHSCL